MSTSASSRAVTPDDLLKVPDSNRYELVDGQLIADISMPAFNWSGSSARKVARSSFTTSTGESSTSSRLSN